MSRDLWRTVVALLFAALVLAVVAKTLFGPRPGRGPERPDEPAARGAPADGTTRPGPEPPTDASSPGLPPAGPSPGEALGVRQPAIAGIVLGPDGAPVLGAAAILWEVQEPTSRELARVVEGVVDARGALREHARRAAERVTDRGGRFSFPATPEVGYALEVRAPGCPAWVGGVPSVPEGRIAIEVRLGAGLEIRGVASTEAGAPASEAEVEAVAEGGWPRPEVLSEASPAVALLRMAALETPVRAACDETGAFSLRGLEPGSHALTARHGRLGFARATGVEAGETDVRLRLEPPVGIEGRVLLADGSPVEDAAVEAWGLSDDDAIAAPLVGRLLRRAPGTALLSTSTRGGGSFRLAPLPPGRYAVLVRGTGIQRSAVDARVGDATGPPIEVLVRPGLPLRGRVVDAAGEGVARVAVEVSGREAPDFHRLETGADGRFASRSLLEQGYRVRALAPPPWSPASLDARPGDGELEIRLAECALVLAGRTVDGAGAAVSGARILAEAAGAAAATRTVPGHLEARSDRSGRFELRREAPVEAHVSIEAPGFVRADLGDLRLDPARPIADLEVRLDRAGRIVGRVVDSGGRSVAGATVRFRSERRSDLSIALDRLGFTLPALSGADGRFHLSLAEARPGADYELAAEARGFLALRGPIVRVEDPARDVEGVEIVLERAARILGTVWGPDGAPVPGAAIVAFRRVGEEILPGGAPGSGYPAGTSTTGHRGAFEMDRLPAGEYRLHASAKGMAEWTGRLSLGPGEEREVEVSMEPGASIGGRVTDPDGAPIEGAAIEARLVGGEPVEDARSGADGTWRIGELPAGAGALDLRISAEGRTTVVLEGVRVGDLRADALLQRPATLTIAPRDLHTGEPLGGARVRLLPASEDLRVHDPVRPEDWTEDRDGGTLSAERVAAGPYRLVVSAPGYLEHESALEVAPGSDERVEVALDPGESISGTVVDGEGRGVEGAIVEVERALAAGAPAATRGEAFPATTDGLGRFRVGGLTVGSYRVVASHADRLEGSTGPVEVGPGAPAAVPVVIALGDGATVTGTVRGRDGRPVAGGFVKLRGTRAGKIAAVGDDGRFELRGVGPGTHALRYEPSGDADRGTEAPVTVEPGIAAVETEIVAE